MGHIFGDFHSNSFGHPMYLQPNPMANVNIFLFQLIKNEEDMPRSGVFAKTQMSPGESKDFTISFESQ
jgi:hypothetical protein